MVKLRLKRMGRKFDAFYRIVAADAKAPRDGKFIEEVGFYNPHSKELRVDTKLWDKWISEGAVPTTTVKNLFKKLNSDKSEVVSTTEEGKLVKVQGKKKKVKAAAPIEAPAEATTDKTPATESTVDPAE